MHNDVRSTLPLVVICGPTASGKTAVAIELAEQVGGEIICADSRTIYAGMDIGTAKPTAAERARVPHWGLDLVAPDQRFTAADFKAYADKKIADIRARGGVPFLVGGTGLYIDAVVYDFQFGGDVDLAQRAAFEAMSIEQLQQLCEQKSIPLPFNSYNRRHLIRALERRGEGGTKRTEPTEGAIIVGIATDRAVLRGRIAVRAEQLFDEGVVEEALTLARQYGWESEAMTGNIYPLVRRYVSGELSLEELKEKFITADWRLAKRQLTWLRRSPHIKWLSLEDVRDHLRKQLAIE